EKNVTNRRLYLPQGAWFDFWTGQRHVGKQDLDWSNPDRSRFPLFVREGGIIPMLLDDDTQTLCDANYVKNANVKTPGDGLLFLIYPATDSIFTLYDGTTLRCQSAGGATTV